MVLSPGVVLLAWAAAQRAAAPTAQRSGGLDVRGVVVAVRECDRVLARVGEHVKFVRDAAADVAPVRLHGAESRPGRVKMRV